MIGAELGYRYRDSPVILPEAGEGRRNDFMKYVPTSWPGARLPHVWLADGMALHDHIDDGYTLFCLGGVQADNTALARAFAPYGAPFTVLDIADERPRDIYGYDLLLLRPDLHVVWRGNHLPDHPQNLRHWRRALRIETDCFIRGMPKKTALTLACGDYEIVRPLLKGKVEVDGVDLTILTDMDSATRHWRFLSDGEFDVAEVSASSYLAARDNGLPFCAIPVFLHRRFRHGFMFINTSKGIEKPADLKGRSIGVKTMMTTAVLWMRGILQSEYGVPLNSVEWVAEIEDDVKVTLPPDIKYSCLPNDKSVETMLAEGELDAVFHSDLIKPFVAKDPRVARLFPDHKAEEMAYFKAPAFSRSCMCSASASLWRRSIHGSP